MSQEALPIQRSATTRTVWRVQRLAAPAVLPPDEAAQLLLQKRYRDLTAQHLNGLIDDLFTKFTGLHFHIAWSPPFPKQWGVATIPSACPVCCRLSGSPLLPDCGTCGQKQLNAALNSNHDGHRFICRLGVHNFWFPIRVRETTIGVAYVQALASPRRTPPACRPFGRSARAPGERRPRPGNDGNSDAPKVMTRSEFDRAAKLLQLVVEHAQTADLADLEAAELTKANRTIRALEREQTRLREKLKSRLPTGNDTTCVLRRRTHTEQIVGRLLECIHRNYGQPITLRQCARKLGMNAAYLSALFARATGMHFKSYLTEFRIERAKELLSQQSMYISDAGCAVGYASENLFRLAFKKATGLPPKIWRDTLRTATPALLMWLLHEMDFLESLEALLGV